jgi:hypothetical protein
MAFMDRVVTARVSVEWVAWREISCSSEKSTSLGRFFSLSYLEQLDVLVFFESKDGK